jgi:imidazolonepropionase-like amidohydrolase
MATEQERCAEAKKLQRIDDAFRKVDLDGLRAAVSLAEMSATERRRSAVRIRLTLPDEFQSRLLHRYTNSRFNLSGDIFDLTEAVRTNFVILIKLRLLRFSMHIPIGSMFLGAALALAFTRLDALAQTITLKAARGFDGRSSRLLSPAVVVVSDGRIQSISDSAPADSNLIDLGDATLLPGLMDAHVHLREWTTGSTAERLQRRLSKSIPEQALDAAAEARATLMAGFTTVRDLGSGNLVSVGLRNAIRNRKVPGPRMVVAGTSIGTTGGHCDVSNSFRPDLLAEGGAASSGVANGADGMRLQVRTNVKYGADVIKICATGGVLSLNDDVESPQLTQEEMNAVVDQAHTMGRRAAAHAHGAEGAKRAVRAGIDSIEHGSFLDDEALTLMRQKGTYFVPTLLAGNSLVPLFGKGLLDPRQERKAKLAVKRIEETFRSAVAKGVKIAFGTDAGVFQHGRNAEEFALLVRYGMAPIDALRASTSVNSELFGVSDSLGTLEPGKIADIIAVPGDPTAEIGQMQKVFFVMKEGLIYRNDRGPDTEGTVRKHSTGLF